MDPPVVTKSPGWSAHTDCRAAQVSTRPSRGVFTISTQTSRRQGTTDTLTSGLLFYFLDDPFSTGYISDLEHFFFDARKTLVFFAVGILTFTKTLPLAILQLYIHLLILQAVAHPNQPSS